MTNLLEGAVGIKTRGHFPTKEEYKKNDENP